MIQQLAAERQGSRFSLYHSCATLSFAPTDSNLQNKGKVLSFFFLLALWTVWAHQEAREVSETAQGKRWYCTLKEGAWASHLLLELSFRDEMLLCFLKTCFSVIDLNMRIYGDTYLETLTFLWNKVYVIKFWIWYCSIISWVCLYHILTKWTGELLRWIFWVNGTLGEVIRKEWTVLTSHSVETCRKCGSGGAVCVYP